MLTDGNNLTSLYHRKQWVCAHGATHSRYDLDHALAWATEHYHGIQLQSKEAPYTCWIEAWRTRDEPR